MFPSHRINIKSEKIKWNVDVSVLRIASRNVSPSTSPPHKQTLETPEWRHHISQVFILLGCPQPGAFLSSAAEQRCKVQCVYAISISQYELEQKQKFWGWRPPLGSASLRHWREFAERIYFNWRNTDTDIRADDGTSPKQRPRKYGGSQQIPLMWVIWRHNVCGNMS